MIEHIAVQHHIQKHILSVLMYRRVARFRDLRPPKTDTNLFSYHLKLLVRHGLIVKTGGGYTLSQNGMRYVDRVSGDRFMVRTQPKVVTMLLIQNADGQVLLQKRTKQPYIDCWTLPYGKLHIDDASVEAAARREASEKLGLSNQPLSHVGDCYIRVRSDKTILSTTLAHICRFNHDATTGSDTLRWVKPHKLSDYLLAPAVEAIVARSFFGDAYFFEEFAVEWRA